MITLQNFVKNANAYTLLLIMGENDTVDALPTAKKTTFSRVLSGVCGLWCSSARFCRY